MKLVALERRNASISSLLKSVMKLFALERRNASLASKVIVRLLVDITRALLGKICLKGYSQVLQ